MYFLKRLNNIFFKQSNKFLTYTVKALLLLTEYRFRYDMLYKKHKKSKFRVETIQTKVLMK